MSTLVATPRQPPGTSRSAPWDRRCDRIRLGLVACWVLLIVALPFLAERSASWDDVRAAVGTGEIDTVRISGELGPGSTGYGTVEIHWRQGLLRQVTTVVQVRGRSGRPSGSTLDGVSRVLHATPSARLASLQPGLTVVPDDHLPSGGRLLGWQVTNGFGLVAFFLVVAGFGLLVCGPQPWRATRWAWFWLLVPPVGSIVFVLLSGPTPGISGPRDPARRLTGGRAFVLSLPLTALLQPYRW